MPVVLTIPPLTFRTIDPNGDADRCVADHRDASAATFGPGRPYEGRASYLRSLREGVAVYPDGFVLAFDGTRCVGHLELQVPYGADVGYVNLFYVPPADRGRGVGALLHAYAERYFRSWEATAVELHVGPENVRAIRFYRRLGYAFAPEPAPTGRAARRASRMWKMTKRLGAADPHPTA